MKLDHHQMEILVLDGDPILSLFIADLIGAPTRYFTSVERLLQEPASVCPFAVFIDLGYLNRAIGFNFMNEIRFKWLETPVILVVDQYSDVGLREVESVCFDLIKKPLHASELRIRVDLRRSMLSRTIDSHIINFGDSRLNVNSRELFGPLGKSYLSPTEVSILKFLVNSDGQLVTREHLKLKCWGNVLVTNNALDRHIHSIRNAIKNVSHCIKMRSVYGKGFLIDVDTCDGQKLAS